MVAVVVALLLAASGVLANPAQAATLEIHPGQSWATVLSTARPGDRVIARSGNHGLQIVTDKALGGVIVVGESRTGTTVEGLRLANVSGLTVTDLTVATPAGATASAVRLTGASHAIQLERLTIRPGALSGLDLSDRVHDVALRASTIDGSAASGTTARGVRIIGPADPVGWVRDVEISGNDIGYAAADIIFIAGAANVSITNNFLHDPRENDDHNDGVQSAGSTGLRIVGNVFRGPGATGPDQAIMLGHSPNTASMRVSDTLVANNLVANWRGTGIIVAGSERTTVAGNTVVETGTSTFRMASLSVGEPNGFTNPGLKVVGNVFEKIDRRGTIEIEDRNCVAIGGTGPADVVADPRLLADGTYRLAADSPCRGLARSGDVPLDDLCGAPRDGAPDAGSREHAAVLTSASLLPQGSAMCGTPAPAITEPEPTPTPEPTAPETTEPELIETAPTEENPNTDPVPVRALTVDAFGKIASGRSCTCVPLLAPRGGAGWGFPIARGMSLTTAGWGYTLDGWGGLHGFTTGATLAPAPSGAPYWPGWDITRGVALLPGGTGGYVLDGWGGIHPFATAGAPLPPRVRGGPYWRGWDIARGIALTPDGTGGYVIDGWGGTHPFAIGGHPAPPRLDGPYWRGWDIVRGFAVTQGGGYVLDGWGGAHVTRRTGTAPPPPLLGLPYLPPNDLFRGIAVLP